MKDIVILGTGGHARDILWLLEDNNEERREWNILGFIDKAPEGKKTVEGYPILGDDGWLLDYKHPVHAVCGIGNSVLRRRIVSRYRTSGVTFPSLVSRKAHVSPRASMGEGCIVFSSAVVTIGVRLENFVYVYFECSIGHDAHLQDFVGVNPSASVSGNVLIEPECEVGTGAHIIQGIHIGPQTVIGAGSVIIRDVPGHCTVVGNPGRILKR
ncbi:acetyltransferase [Oscillibacter sp.]|jgi:sugar O-acyltransferase (sialic acid O-acetyltransferase NeuD family)|uniref:acetyltransferase n=1 Tax=Oscillibacter sp. TaxID=1945593 RepID=UPI0021743939|nr:acetyltransferase [Oscillibacter sp.]MCI9648352.1 acetyltransferase [Oscillibacter sp.]